MSKMRGSGAIFLVRHGESALSGSFCGSTDPPLTSRGRMQAQRAARRLSRFSIDVFYSSPLLRALQTALVIERQAGVSPTTRSSLREIHFGAWEGMRFEEIRDKWPRLAERWAKDPMTARIPGAEPFASLRRRIKRFLWSTRIRFLERNVLIVAHGGPLSAITLALLGLPDRDLFRHIPPLGSVQVIRGQNRKRIHPIC